MPVQWGLGISPWAAGDLGHLPRPGAVTQARHMWRAVFMPRSTSSSHSSNNIFNRESTAYALELLGPLKVAATRRANDTAYLPKLQIAASRPINIALMSGLWWAEGTTDGCMADGVPLDCRVQHGGTNVSIACAQRLTHVLLRQGQKYGNLLYSVRDSVPEPIPD